MMTASHFPQGILPVLPVNNVETALEFYTNILKFEEAFRQPGPDGVLVNGQVRFEGSALMLNLNPEHAELEGGGVYFWVRLFDQDIDSYFNALKTANVQIVEDIKDQFWGDRSFTIKDCNNYYLAFNKAIEN